MKKYYFITFIFCLCLSGCINFNRNKSKDVNEKEEVEAASDPKDDAIMESNNHLKFKGVPIDGTLKQFVSRMKRKGFKYIDSDDGVVVLQGDFAAYKECIIYVSTLDNKDLVSRKKKRSSKTSILMMITIVCTPLRWIGANTKPGLKLIRAILSYG